MLDGSWGDASVSVAARLDTSCGRAQMVAAVRVSLDSCVAAYGCVLDWQTNALYAAKWSGSCSAGSTQTVSVGGLELGVWYTLVTQALGNVVTCTVAGGDLPDAIVVTYTDSSSDVLAPGSIRLSVSQGAGTFAGFAAIAE